MKKYSLNIIQEKTFAEFFAGIGLMRLGLEKEGWKAVFANDICRDKHEMYSAHFGNEGAHFLIEDIHNIGAEQIPTVAMATASFPCNDLSLAGMRKGLVGKQSSAIGGAHKMIRRWKSLCNISKVIMNYIGSRL